MGGNRILSVGLVCLDVVSVCNEYPEEGTDQRVKKMHMQKGGNAANTASVLALLGNKVDFFGCIPKNENDFFARQGLDFIKNEMNSFGVNMEYAVEKEDAQLAISSVVINNTNGSRTILAKQNITEVSFEDFTGVNLQDYCWIHFEGRNLEDLEKMVQRVVSFNSTKSSDDKIFISVEFEKPKRPNLPILLPYIDLVLISEEFAKSKGYQTAVACVEGFKNQAKRGAHIVCAWGSDGAASVTAGDTKDAIMTSAVSPPDGIVRDTLGAGDTFNGMIISHLCRGRGNSPNVRQSVEYGCKLTGYKVGFYGYECLRKFATQTT